jgi:exopolysaccharide biosynthesis polyprenyl glycosylphosphotransferase
MLQRQRQIRAQVQKGFDALLFGLSLLLAYILRSNFKTAFSVFGGYPNIEELHYFTWLFPVVILIGPLLLELQGFYDRTLLTRRASTIWQLAKGCILAVVVLMSLLFVLKMTLARAVILLFGPVSFLVLLLKDEAVRMWNQTKFGQSQFKRRFILAGTHQDSARLLQELEDGGSDSIEIVSNVNLNESSVEDLISSLHEHSANGVILSAKHTLFGQVEKAIQACELEGVEAWLLADFFNTQISQTSLDALYGRPLLIFRSTPEDSWPKMAKQVLDVAGALAFLAVAAIPFALVALTIRITSPGPILFRQKRAGLNGRPFTMLKFRSMVTNAEQRKAELEALNEMHGPVFKVSNDPRITPIGYWLRRFSIDEWPQMFNVLTGDMSLVGPRPLPVDEVNRFDDMAHRRRLSVKPGLTCLWQVRGRNNVRDFKDWVRLDLEYIDNWSLWLDVKILVRTVPVVLMGTGAK